MIDQGPSLAWSRIAAGSGELLVKIKTVLRKSSFGSTICRRVCYNYLLGEPPLCYDSTMSEPNAKCSVFGCKERTQHSISQPQRTEEQHGFIHFLRQRPATVSKNCSCVLTTSRLTVSPTSVSTRQE